MAGRRLSGSLWDFGKDRPARPWGSTVLLGPARLGLPAGAAPRLTCRGTVTVAGSPWIWGSHPGSLHGDLCLPAPLKTSLPTSYVHALGLTDSISSVPGAWMTD